MIDKKFSTPIQFKVLIRRPAGQVFDLLTQAEGWDSWFTTCMTFNREVGGEILFKWKDWGPDKITVTARGQVISLNRPSSLSFHWNFGISGGPTRVDFTLSETPEGTLVKLTDSGFPDTPAGHEALIECATGWGEALTLMKIYLEHGLSYK